MTNNAMAIASMVIVSTKICSTANTTNRALIEPAINFITLPDA